MLECNDSIFINNNLKDENVNERVKQYVNGTHKNHIKALNKNNLYELTSQTGKQSDQREKFIAKRLFELSHSKREKVSNVMEIIDYEIPVNSVYPKNNVNVDLIGQDNENLYLIELKNDVSNESLLRAVLEIKTYIERIKKIRLHLKDLI